MKKLSFAVAILLALTMVACNNFVAPTPPEDGPRTMVTADGRTLVALDINIAGSNGRALTENMAIVATEQYEVAFFDGVDVYRTSWVDGQTGRLWVNTPYNYAGFGNAILFAGYRNGTLLAVGTLEKVDGVAGTLITAGSRTVTFVLEALENDIFGDGDPDDSTFQLVGHDGAAAWDVYLSANMGTFEEVTIAGYDYPLFELPNDAEFEATWAVDNLPATGIVLAAEAKVIPRIMTVPGYHEAFDVRGFFDDLLDTDTGDDIGVGPFAITLTTASNMGLIRLAFEIPVKAINEAPQVGSANPNAPTLTTVQPGTWYIRGGIANTTLDMGIDRDSSGGAILLGIGEYEEEDVSGWITIITENK
ncbi:MAG: hypothetical protein FWD36_04930 [Treponema sp.]|nr:hypothetical protein [Treponema sp.]